MGILRIQLKWKKDGYEKKGNLFLISKQTSQKRRKKYPQGSSLITSDQQPKKEGDGGLKKKDVRDGHIIRSRSRITKCNKPIVS